jgi:hypothetical protein
MPLHYILQQVGYKMGLNPADANQRNVILRFVNEAAIELYQISDMAGCMEEQYFKVNSDQTIALPDYVGQVRAMREANSHIAIKLSQMRPRYNQINWEDRWRNWRLKGLQTLQTTLTNQSFLVVSVKAVETPAIIVNIVGASVGSSKISESIVMDATTKQSANTYLNVTSFTKTTINNYDIILSDIDNNQISYIANDKLKAQFQVIDISTAPWVQPNISPLHGWVEVLYKRALPWFSNDNDEFPAVGYDNVIVNKCLQLYFEEQKDITTAQAYYMKANQSLAQIHEDANRGTEDVVAMCEHPHDRVNPTVGFGRDYRYAYRLTGR